MTIDGKGFFLPLYLFIPVTISDYIGLRIRPYIQRDAVRACDIVLMDGLFYRGVDPDEKLIGSNTCITLYAGWNEWGNGGGKGGSGAMASDGTEMLGKGGWVAILWL